MKVKLGAWKTYSSWEISNSWYKNVTTWDFKPIKGNYKKVRAELILKLSDQSSILPGTRGILISVGYFYSGYDVWIESRRCDILRYKKELENKSNCGDSIEIDVLGSRKISSIDRRC